MTTSGSPYLAVLDAERGEGPSSAPDMLGRGGERAGQQQQRSASRANKALAAISGAVVTSLTMTPFDVIKTRMQTQRAPDPLFQPAPSSAQASSQAGGIACCQSTFVNEQGVLCRYDPRDGTHLGTKAPASSPSAGTGPGPHIAHSAPNKFANGVSSATRPRIAPFAPTSVAGSNLSAAACIYPDKSMAVHELERLRGDGRLSGLWDGVVKVGRQEGMRGLWRGLTPTLVMTVPSQVTYMTCYDFLRTALLAMGEPPATTTQKASLSNISTHTMSAALIAGALARGASATLVTPLELLRTRLQASGSRNLTSLIKDLGREMKHESPTVLWRGLVPTLYRDVPFSAIYFTGYESMKRIITGSGLGERHVLADTTGSSPTQEQLQQQHRDFVVAFASGATSGIFAAIVTQPFDLIKTRLQAVEEQGWQQGARGPTTLQLLRDIVAREGTSGLFRGISPRIAKVAPACGIMIASFELVARWLDERSA